jgi:hypothetical protein
MDATVGVEHRKVQERVALGERRLKELRDALATTRSEQNTAQARRGELLAEVRVLQERSGAAHAARDTSAERFRALLDTSLLEDSGLEPPGTDLATVGGYVAARGSGVPARGSVAGNRFRPMPRGARCGRCSDGTVGMCVWLCWLTIVGRGRWTASGRRAEIRRTGIRGRCSGTELV